MECKGVQPNLQRFLDSDLPPEQATLVEAHLCECDTCWQEMKAMRDLEVELTLDEPYGPAPLPEDFTELVMQRVYDERPTGVHLVWPWLRQRWSRRQFASVAYAMSATMVVVSAGNMLFLWNESTSLVTTWGIKAQAYWDALHAYLGASGDYVGILWQGLLSLLHLG